MGPSLAQLDRPFPWAIPRRATSIHTTSGVNEARMTRKRLWFVFIPLASSGPEPKGQGSKIKLEGKTKSFSTVHRSMNMASEKSEPAPAIRINQQISLTIKETKRKYLVAIWMDLYNPVRLTTMAELIWQLLEINQTVKILHRPLTPPTYPAS